MDILNLLSTLIVGCVIGHVAAFIITLLYKWRVVEYYDTRRRQSWPAWCSFCVGWWCCVGAFIVFVCVTPFKIEFVLIPVIGSIVSQKLTSWN